MSVMPEGTSSSLVGLLWAWWRGDGIRLPISQGRLLRLGVPCFLEVGSTRAQVVERSVGRDARGPFVLYRCRIPDGERELRVRPGGCTGRCRLSWETDGEERVDLDEQDVVVFEPKSRENML